MDKRAAQRHRHLHPALSYAFLLSAGVISINGALMTGLSLADQAKPAAIQVSAKTNSAPPDIGSLKKAAAEFSFQLAEVKKQVTELYAHGHPASPVLIDAIGEGEQLADMIAHAATLEELNGVDAANRLESIGAKIRANTKY
jgi:hypothetical protein